MSDLDDSKDVPPRNEFESLRTNQGRITDKEKGLIFGDLDNSPRVASARDSARGSLTVQPSGGNGSGSVEIFPSGTSNRSHFLATNNSDPDNFGFVEFEVNGSDAWMHSASKGTGTGPRTFEFQQFPDGVRVHNQLLVGDIGRAPSGQLEVDHTGAMENAIQVGDPNTIGNDTGIYMRTNGIGKIHVGDAGKLHLISNSTEGRGIYLDGRRNTIKDLLNLPPQSSAPIGTPTAGDIAVQDGVNWDPAATGQEELLVYLNGAWEAK